MLVICLHLRDALTPGSVRASGVKPNLTIMRKLVPCSAPLCGFAQTSSDIHNYHLGLSELVSAMPHKGADQVLNISWLSSFGKLPSSRFSYLVQVVALSEGFYKAILSSWKSTNNPGLPRKGLRPSGFFALSTYDVRKQSPARRPQQGLTRTPPSSCCIIASSDHVSACPEHTFSTRQACNV